MSLTSNEEREITDYTNVIVKEKLNVEPDIYISDMGTEIGVYYGDYDLRILVSKDKVYVVHYTIWASYRNSLKQDKVDHTFSFDTMDRVFNAIDQILDLVKPRRLY